MARRPLREEGASSSYLLDVTKRPSEEGLVCVGVTRY
jgi:hypothetical protein